MTTTERVTLVELAAMAGHHVAGTAYHWQHGWHPLDVSTALQWNKKKAAEALGKKGSKFHHEEPEEFNKATKQTPKFIASAHPKSFVDTKPQMPYHASKTLTGAVMEHNHSGATVVVAKVSASKTHILATDGSKHKLSDLTPAYTEDKAKLAAFKKAKAKTAVKQYTIHSRFTEPKDVKTVEGPEIKGNDIHGNYVAGKSHHAEPVFPLHESLPGPNVHTWLTPSEKSSVQAYTGSAYADINRKLREGSTTHQHVKNIDAALAKATPLPEGTILHRGVNVEAIRNLQAGDNFIEPGFSSTSRNPDIGFTQNITRLHITSMHPDLKAMDVKGISNFPGESEVILHRGTKYTVKQRVEHEGHVHLYVHAEPSEKTPAAKTATSTAARVSVRASTYQGVAGHTVTGKDTEGRKVKVFVPGEKAEAAKVAANIKAGKNSFDSTPSALKKATSEPVKPKAQDDALKELIAKHPDNPAYEAILKHAESKNALMSGETAKRLAFAEKYKTDSVQLQGGGSYSTNEHGQQILHPFTASRHPAKPASEFKPGHTIVYNGGSTATVTRVEHKGSMVHITTKADGESSEFTSKHAAGTRIAFGSEGDAHPDEKANTKRYSSDYLAQRAAESNSAFFKKQTAETLAKRQGAAEATKQQQKVDNTVAMIQALKKTSISPWTTSATIRAVDGLTEAVKNGDTKAIKRWAIKLDTAQRNAGEAKSNPLRKLASGALVYANKVGASA